MKVERENKKRRKCKKKKERKCENAKKVFPPDFFSFLQTAELHFQDENNRTKSFKENALKLPAHLPTCP
jgi:hypothetical protein